MSSLSFSGHCSHSLNKCHKNLPRNPFELLAPHSEHLFGFRGEKRIRVTTAILSLMREGLCGMSSPLACVVIYGMTCFFDLRSDSLPILSYALSRKPSLNRLNIHSSTRARQQMHVSLLKSALSRKSSPNKLKFLPSSRARQHMHTFLSNSVNIPNSELCCHYTPGQISKSESMYPSALITDHPTSIPSSAYRKTEPQSPSSCATQQYPPTRTAFSFELPDTSL